MKRITKKEYQGPVVKVARMLLGKFLVRKLKNRVLMGKIVETEAYHQDDPASHSFQGITPRNQIMFGEAGKVYVYFTYGSCWCFNVVAGDKGHGAAVLIRALEPIEGIEIMKKNRHKKNIHDLCSGPGKLCQAFNVGKNDYGKNLLKSDLKICKNNKKESFKIVKTTRIGISQGSDKHYRFYIKDSPFVSRF